MASSWKIQCFAQPFLSKEETQNIINTASDRVKEFEDEFSVFKNSPFNQINKDAGLRETKISHQCLKLLEQSLYYYKETQGVFNIAFRSDPGFEDLNDIVINKEKETVFLPHKEMKLSLGGIGKGAAVDLTYEFLKSKGLINFIVNGAGDIRVHSHENAPRKWKIGIKNPFNPELSIGHIELSNESIATSGEYIKENHIKSSASNRPISVTVISDSVTKSDVWATYLCSLNTEKAIKEANDKNIFSILINDQGKVFHSKRSIKAATRKRQ